jgi:hypothetical protein
MVLINHAAIYSLFRAAASRASRAAGQALCLCMEWQPTGTGALSRTGETKLEAGEFGITRHVPT